MSEKWVTTTELGREWRLSSRTILRYIRRDGLPAAYYGEGSKRPRRILINVEYAKSWARRRRWVRNTLDKRGSLERIESNVAQH